MDEKKIPWNFNPLRKFSPAEPCHQDNLDSFLLEKVRGQWSKIDILTPSKKKCFKHSKISVTRGWYQS